MSTKRIELAPRPAIQFGIGIAFLCTPLLSDVIPAKIAQAVGAEVRGATMVKI